MSQAITRCRICGNRRLEAVLELGVQKLTGVFPASPNADLLGGPLELVRCVPRPDVAVSSNCGTPTRWKPCTVIIMDIVLD